MADIDEFATTLLEEAKRFLEKSDDGDGPARTAYLHASLMLAFCSLEAHLNAISEEFAARSEFSIVERGLLLEKEIRLQDGAFVLGGLRMARLEDRISFLHRHFAGQSIDKTQGWWSQLMSAVDVRNKLTHPKNLAPVDSEQVRRALEEVVSVIDHLYKVIYKKPFPSAALGLQSRLSF